MLELRTGSRLHFGLMELAPNQPLRYGGLGLMLRRPQMVVRLQPRRAEPDSDGQPVRSAEHANLLDAEVLRRVRLTLTRVLDLLVSSSSPAAQGLERLAHGDDFDIAVVEHPPLHCGLGCGTQLAAAVAASIVIYARGVLADRRGQVTDESHLHSPVSTLITASELAQLSGRGKRSGIGLHGFFHGGLIQDLGQITEDHSSARAHGAPRALQTRSQSFPDEWRIVLLTSRDPGDMHGSQEDRLIEKAGQQANSQRDEMLKLSHLAMSAAQSNDFDAFVAALERYMDLASRLFSSVQAGRYRNAQVAESVDKAQAAGLSAVGQSSWGPTVFGFASSEAEASAAASQLCEYAMHNRLETIVTQAAPSGAVWQATRYGVQHAS